MTALLKPYQWLLYAALAIAVLLAIRWEYSRVDQQGYDRAEAKYLARIAADTARAHKDRADLVAHYRAQEQQWLDRQQENARETAKHLARVRADNAASADAGRRLREQITRLAACPAHGAGSASPSAGAASDIAPARSTADLLAIVQRRLDEAADGIARFADESRAAGKGCERDYDTLTGVPP